MKMSKLDRGYQDKNGGYDVIGLNYHTLLTIKLPDSWALRAISRSLFLAVILFALPSLCSLLGASTSASLREPDARGFKILPILLRDLVDEGLIKSGHRGFVLSDGVHGMDLAFLRDAGIDLLTVAELREKKVNEHDAFDFAFAMSFRGIQLIDGIVKDGGLVVYQLGHDYPSDEMRLLTSFKIVYLRRFEETIVAMRKVANGVANPSAKPELCRVTTEKRKAALKGLEDVYLEPPKRETLAGKSSFTSRKIKFLPDLLKDPLDEYPRRVFVTDDSMAVDWFYENYPVSDQEFDVYDMDSRAKGAVGKETGVLSWLKKNVRRDDYVVLKADAQVVEEMLNDRSLCLVDELFLDCKNQWQDEEVKEEDDGRKRAYWECVALYGKVMDEGIAVHQWWS